MKVLLSISQASISKRISVISYTMQQHRGGGQGMEQNQHQDQRLKTAAENQQQQQPPFKCPRCESLNTKFCYYNNYSLSQPRYFCKTCRRYWTQGGTQRNVPIGGGSRKGKRAKASSSSGDSLWSQAPHIPPQHVAQAEQSRITSNPMISVSDAFGTKESGGLASSSAISSIGSYYPGVGFLSSLAGIQSMNQPQPQPFNYPLNQSISAGGSSSNFGLLQGYGVPSFGSQQQQSIQHTQFFPMGDNQKPNVNMFPSDHQEWLTQSSMLATSDSSQLNWHHQSFIHNSDPTTVSEAAMWSVNNNSGSSTNNADTSNTMGSSLNPNQWPDFPGYGTPP